MDLEEQDKSDWWELSKKKMDISYEEFIKTESRITRFQNAFDTIFKDLHYIGKKPGHNTIYFSKNGQEIPIEKLSTGEKQIVFRGIDLLHQAEENAIVLIDEPELSLHPRWQTKILPFYLSLFENQYKQQTAQVIVATHSEYVLQSGVEKTDDVKICILTKKDDVISADKMEETLLESNNAEINYLAFGVNSIEYHIQLFAALHNWAQENVNGVGSSIKTLN